MNIQLNGEKQQFGGTTLTELLTEQGFADTVVATAVNGNFVAADVRDGFAMSEGDQVEVLAPMQGG